MKRKYGIYYDLHTVEFVTIDIEGKSKPDFSNKELFQENEAVYQLLWKDYFKSTNIKSRKNMKSHLQHVPRRYWKYLTEKGLDS